MIQITLPDSAQIHGAPVRGAEIAARSGDANADTALAIRIDGVLRDLANLIEQDAHVEVEAEALRRTCSPESLPPVEGRSKDKEQLAEAAAG